ncbi:MAG: radical SAM protein [Elusimicrobiota bacterium]
MKLLLIYPPREHYIFGITPHVYVDCESGFYPPIGLMYLAASIEKNSDWEVEIIDAYTEQYDFPALEAGIKKSKPDVVGIYFSTYYIYDPILTAKIVKGISKEIVVVAGGPHVALYPVETIKIQEIDYAVYGEGEFVFAELLKEIQKNRKGTDGIPINLPGVLTKSNAGSPMKLQRIENLDGVPFPARHLSKYHLYKSILAKGSPITTIVSSRGCPFKCYFCSNLESGQKVRFRSAKNVVDEIHECVEKFGITDFLFFDELFTLKKERVVQICDEIDARGLKIHWHCRSRADTLDREMVQKMKKAGCRLIQFGIETGSQRLQKLINKNLNLEKVEENIKMVKSEGILTYADFMFGLPSETDEESQMTLEYAKRIGIDYVVFGMFHPVPGSVFYDEGIGKGLFNDFWREIVNNPTEKIEDHSYTRKDRQKYEVLMSKAYREFYIRPRYLLQRLMHIDSVPQFIWQVKSGTKVFSKFLFEKTTAGMKRKGR